MVISFIISLEIKHPSLYGNYFPQLYPSQCLMCISQGTCENLLTIISCKPIISCSCG